MHSMPVPAPALFQIHHQMQNLVLECKTPPAFQQAAFYYIVREIQHFRGLLGLAMTYSPTP